MSSLPHDPRLTKLSRWCVPDPWDTFVAAACSYFCFGGPFVVAGCALLPFLFVLPIVIVWWVVAEGAWLVHRRYLRHRHEQFTPAPDNPARRKQMERMLLMKDDVIPDFREFLREWFRGADPRLIRRENVKEFVRYGFYGGVDGPLGQAEEEEIEWWIGEVEHTWGIAFEPGRTNGLKFMAHMREPLKVFHQPLAYYAYSHCAEALAGLVLRFWGFTWHKCGDTGVTYWLRLGPKPLPRTPSRTPSPGMTPSNSYEAFLSTTPPTESTARTTRYTTRGPIRTRADQSTREGGACRAPCAGAWTTGRPSIRAAGSSAQFSAGAAAAGAITESASRGARPDARGSATGPN